MLQPYSHQQTIFKTNSTFISMDDIISAPDDGYHRNHQQISRFACLVSASRIELNFMADYTDILIFFKSHFLCNKNKDWFYFWNSN